MEKIKIWNDNPSDSQLAQVADIIEKGGIAIIPTDSVYAIVCDATQPKAIERLCDIKHINPSKNNLSIICNDISMASEYARLDNKDFHLLKEYTPGPVTFLFRSASTLPKAFKSRKIVGIRIPDNLTARKISQYMNKPLLTTSIHWDDDDYAINPELIAESHEKLVDLMVIGEEGNTELTTILDCTDKEPVVTRQGKTMIEQ